MSIDTISFVTNRKIRNLNKRQEPTSEIKPPIIAICDVEIRNGKCHITNVRK